MYNDSHDLYYNRHEAIADIQTLWCTKSLVGVLASWQPIGDESKMRKIVSKWIRIPFTKWRVRRYRYVNDDVMFVR